MLTRENNTILKLYKSLVSCIQIWNRSLKQDMENWKQCMQRRATQMIQGDKDLSYEVMDMFTLYKFLFTHFMHFSALRGVLSALCRLILNCDMGLSMLTSSYNYLHTNRRHAYKKNLSFI